MPVEQRTTWTSMTTLSAEDLRQIVDVAVQAALKVAAKNEPGPKVGPVDKLDERCFRRVEKLSGEERQWREWSFAFRTAVGMGSVKARKVLEVLEKTTEDPDWEEVLISIHKGEEEKLGAELYAILTQLMTGEGMTVVRGVGGDGGLRGGSWRGGLIHEPQQGHSGL